MSRMNFSTRRRTPADLVRAASKPSSLALCESLEPRVHLAAYTGESILDLFDVPGDLAEVVSPPSAGAANFGSRAVGLGDVDGDGFGDVAVSAPGDFFRAPDLSIKGFVFAFSGRTGEEIWRLPGGVLDFGQSMAAAGDANQDGTTDLLVGSPSKYGGWGEVVLVSGSSGAVLDHWLGSTHRDRFGTVVVAAGGVGGADFLVGAPWAGTSGAGMVLGFRWGSSEPVFTLSGEQGGEWFGAALRVGDVGPAEGGAGDGIPDILVGAPEHEAGMGFDAEVGRAYLFDGADLGLRLTLTGVAAGDRFGSAVAFAGTPGARWLLVGAPGRDVDIPGLSLAVDAGELHVFTAAGEVPDSEALPARIASTIAGTHYAFRIEEVGDIDGDGVGDVYMAEAFRPVANGTPQFFSGARLTVTGSAHRPVAGDLLIGVGDIDGDGFADVYEAIPGEGRGVLVSSLGLVPPREVRGASEDLTFIFGSGRHGFAFIDGVFTPYAEIPGIGTDAMILGVNNGRVIVGRLPAPAGPPGFFPSGEYIIVEGGVRVLLSDAITEVVGAAMPDLSDLDLVKIGNDGTILFNQNEGLVGEQRAWAFRDGVLMLLWAGTVGDVNDAGVIVGTRETQEISGREGVRVALAGPGGEVEVLPGMLAASAINNDGAVLGVGEGSRLVLIRPGGGGGGGGEAVDIIGSGSVTDMDLGDDGTVYFQTVRFVGRATVRTDWVWTAERGAQTLADASFGVAAGQLAAISSVIGFATGGRLLMQAGVLTPVAEELAWGIGEGRPVFVLPTSLGEIVVGVNPFGDVLLWSRGAGGSGGAWTASRVDNLAALGAGHDFVAYVDPRDGAAYGFLLNHQSVVWGSITSQGEEGGAAFNGFAINRLGAPLVAEGATVFFASDGRAILAGLDASGDLVVYFETGLPRTNFLGWSSSNLTAEHIEARGQSFVPVAGNLTGFSARWGADHIAYLDESGHVQAVWWAPGDALWRTDPITVPGQAALTGTLTSFVTPWDTLHINAFDDEGRAAAVWWAPGFGGQWLISPLVDDLEPPRIDASATAYITPWNALNIAGVDDETGEAVVYWWTPATGVWAVEAIAAEPGDGDEPAPLTGPVHGAATAAGGAGGAATQSIVARDADGHLAGLFWSAADNTWRLEDLTEIAIAPAGG